MPYIRLAGLLLSAVLVALVCQCSTQEDIPGVHHARQAWQRGSGSGSRALLAEALHAPDALNHDTTVEDAILQTYNPDTRREQQQQQQQQQPTERHQKAPRVGAEDAAQQAQQQAQQARRLRDEQRRAAQDKAAQQAQHSRLLERQRREAAQARERVEARRETDRQQQSLGRGSLRDRAQRAGKQPGVAGSNKDDVFAQQTERALAAARARAAEQRAALAGVQAGAAGSGAIKQQQQGQQRQQGFQAGEGQALGAAQAAPGHRRRGAIPVPLITLMTLGMAAAAGLGALPFFFVRSLSDAATGVATAVACGVMLAASFDLIHEGQPYGAALTVVGVLLGGWFIKWVQERLEAYEDISFESLQGSSARKTMLMVGIMAAHALGEGCAVGVSFCGERGWAQGVLTTLAIGVHNVPEGLAKATVLVGQGVPAGRALLWSVATCLPQPLVAVPSFVFVDAFMVILPVALGFAAGCMIWMVFAELLPDALERAEGAQVATAATVAAAGLEGFRMLFASLEQPDGSFGGGDAAHIGGVVSRMGPALLVLLPAVAAAAGSGAGLGGSILPPPVAWGVAAAAALSGGGGAMLDQLLWRPQVPSMHTLAAAAMGAVLAVLLHRQLLQWADVSAAVLTSRKLHALHKEQKGAGGTGGGRHGPPDVEALEFASLYQQHHMHHHPERMHHHSHTHPLPVGINHNHDDSGSHGVINGHAGSGAALHLQAPHHRGSTANVNGAAAAAALPNGASSSQLAQPSGAATPTGFGLGGAVTPVPRSSWRAAFHMPAPQLAAAGTTLLALAATAVANGWHLACTLLLLDTDRSAVLLPAAALLVAGPGLGAGALARVIPSRSGAAMGAWAAGLLAVLTALAAAFTAARAPESAHTAAMVKRFLYPHGITDTAEALTGGALCTAAWFALAAGSAVKPASARGGLVLGLAVAGLLSGLRFALCSFTPYCLSVHTLLQQQAR